MRDTHFSPQKYRGLTDGSTRRFVRRYCKNCLLLFLVIPRKGLARQTASCCCCCLLIPSLFSISASELRQQQTICLHRLHRVRRSAQQHHVNNTHCTRARRLLQDDASLRFGSRHQTMNNKKGSFFIHAFQF